MRRHRSHTFTETHTPLIRPSAAGRPKVHWKSDIADIAHSECPPQSPGAGKRRHLSQAAALTLARPPSSLWLVYGSRGGTEPCQLSEAQTVYHLGRDRSRAARAAPLGRSGEGV